MATAEEMARVLGVSTRTLENYEQGRNLPTGTVPWKLYRLLGPELFGRLADLIPESAPPEGMTLPVSAGGRTVEARVFRQNDDAARLQELIRIAQELIERQSR